MQPTITGLSKGDQLKYRVLCAKAKLPAQYMSAFMDLFPEYDNDKDKERVTLVFQCRKFDDVIVSKIEALVEHLKNS